MNIQTELSKYGLQARGHKDSSTIELFFIEKGYSSSAILKIDLIRKKQQKIDGNT